MQAPEGERIDRLYPSQELALLGSRHAKPERWVLRAEQADGIGVGSPSSTWGWRRARSKTLKAEGSGVAITLEIDAVYALLRQQPQFWKKAAIDGKIGSTGCRSRWGTSPPCCGAIEFDRLGTGRSSHQLFDSKEQAGTQVRTLTPDRRSQPGSRGGQPHPLSGVDIGKVEQVELDPSLGRFVSRPSWISNMPPVSRSPGRAIPGAGQGRARRVAHLDTLIRGAFVEASPGRGAGRSASPCTRAARRPGADPQEPLRRWYRRRQPCCFARWWWAASQA